MPQALAIWVKRKPGPFVARTENAVWRQAWANFCDGRQGGIELQLDFMMRLSEAGIDVRPTTLGRFVLDRCPRAALGAKS